MDDLDLGQELGVVADHLRGDVEDDRRLLRVRGRRVDFPADLAVEHQPVDRERRPRARSCRSSAASIRRHVRYCRSPSGFVLKSGPHDVVLLPRPQVERLPGERPFRVRQVVDDRDLAIGARVARHFSSPAHLLTGAAGFLRERLAERREAEVCEFGVDALNHAAVVRAAGAVSAGGHLPLEGDIPAQNHKRDLRRPRQRPRLERQGRELAPHGLRAATEARRRIEGVVGDRRDRRRARMPDDDTPFLPFLPDPTRRPPLPSPPMSDPQRLKTTNF